MTRLLEVIDPMTLLLLARCVLGVAVGFAFLFCAFFTARYRSTGRRVFCEPTLRGDDTLQRLRTRAGA